MERSVITVVCAAGLLLAGAFAVRWGRGERSPEPAVGDDEPTAELVARLTRTGAVAVVGGVIAGVLIGGLGSRLVMRVLAVTSGDAVQGSLTEAEERVGEVTTGGTLGLIIFVGVLGGVFGGLLYAMVRRWLPRRVWLAGLAYGVLLLGAFARLDPLSPDNRDFRILSPSWLAVLLIAVLFPLYGITVASVVERLDRGWSHKPLSFFPVLILGLAPIIAVPAAVVVGASVAGRRLGLRAGPRVGQSILGVVALAGLAWTGAGVVTILTA